MQDASTDSIASELRSLADSVEGSRDTLARQLEALADTAAEPASGVAAEVPSRTSVQAIVDSMFQRMTGSTAATETLGDDRWWGAPVRALADVTGLSRGAALDWVETALFLTFVWGVRQLVLMAVRRQTQDVRVLYRWRKTSSYIAVVVAFFGLVAIWVGSLGALGTFLGLLTAGVAIALRDPLVNLAGWAFVLWRKPFAPGDRVAIRDHVGDVIDQRLFQFTILEVGTVTGAGQSTGRIIHIPNGWVFTDSLTNYTGAFAYVWHEIAVVVTFESDWKAMKRLLAEVADEHLETMSEDAERTLRRAARDYLIFYTKLTPIVYTSVVGEGVQLTLRFLTSPRRIRGSEEAVWEAILDALAAHDDIDLAYPTTRFFDNRAEGKPGTGGPVGGMGDGGMEG